MFSFLSQGNQDPPTPSPLVLLCSQNFRILLGKEKEQIKYCFTVYDLTGKGFIAKEEMVTLLQNCLNLTGQEEEGEDGIKVGSLAGIETFRFCKKYFL